MESVANWIVNGVLILLACGFCGYVRIKIQMDKLECSLDKKIDALDRKINEEIHQRVYRRQAG